MRILPIRLKSFLEKAGERTADFAKKPKTLMIAGLCGILLIFASSLLPRSSEKNTSAAAETKITAEEYRDALQAEVCRIVTGITGDEAPTVVITLESGMRYSYADATEITSSDSTGSTDTASRSEIRSYITVRTSDGGEQALLITEKMPEIRGVAVICRNGDSEAIAEKIRGAVTAAFDITSKRVYIAGGSSYEKR